MSKEARPASLIQVTTTARRGIIGCIIFIVIVIIFQAVKDRFTTTPTTPTGQSDPYLVANNIFGKDLPSLNVQSLSLAAGSSPDFGVENRFGEFPKSVNVYKVSKPREKFGTVEKAEEVASRLKFQGPFQKLSEQELQWKTSTRILSFDKVLKRWKFQVDLTKDAQAIKEHRISTDKKIYEAGAKTVLSGIGIATDEITDSSSEVHFMQMVNGQLQEVTSPSSADFVQVQLFWRRVVATPRENVYIDGKTQPNSTPPLYGNVFRENPASGSVTVLLSNNGGSVDDLFGFELTEWEIDPISGVYSIITPEEAWDKLQKGGAALTQLTKNGKSKLNLYEPLNVKRFVTSNEDVSLGYFESNEYLEYQLPIYIFQGRAELNDGTEASYTFFVDALKR